MSRPKRLHRLHDAQRDASDPRVHASVSASAGTGKTHVLTARVLRLLLAGVDPAAILCLTFTKAAAAEMAERIHQRLAAWVRLPDKHLHADLFALGAPHGADDTARARTLFASVLDATGGGLRIQTIHAFAATLLAGFPAEAGLNPGFTPLDERGEGELARSTLAEMLAAAEAGGDCGLLADIEGLSHRLGEDKAQKLLMAMARAPEAMAEFGSREAIAPALRRLFDLPTDDDTEAELARRCHDDQFDMHALEAARAMHEAWGSARGIGHVETIANWRNLPSEARFAQIAKLKGVFLKDDGLPRLAKGHAPQHETYAEHAERLGDACAQLIELRARADLAAAYAAAARAGQAFAAAYKAAKRAAGLVDFDDLIRGAEGLLLQSDIGDWVRYKLDQATDHILVDEAQDTNAAQWNIVRALTEEFFQVSWDPGEAAKRRTLFTVGDYKQAIFSFQGTDPAAFDDARRRFATLAAGAEQDFRDVALDRSFRSSPPVLELVDALIADVGPDELGLPAAAEPHASATRFAAGSVTLWPPVAADDGNDAEEEGEEGWIPNATRLFADRLAERIAGWLADPFMLDCRGRVLRPEDILILLRRRGDLAGLLVARLTQRGVPVAGVDRLRLDAPLAVQDMLAAARFAAQPLDDLNLASLLVSPLFGWSQDDLFAAAHGRKGPLWAQLRELASDDKLGPNEVGRVELTVRQLLEILNKADFVGPHDLFETLLTGPLQGRRKMLGRLGPEALDPLDELLSSALDYEAEGTQSLDGFLAWFARGEVDIKRDPSAPLDAVRIMTSHGAKGLQAPVVILADATGDPDKSPREYVTLGMPPVPFFRPAKAQMVKPVRERAEQGDRAERAEHHRLLYVALTRAEEHLFVGGAAVGKAPRPHSWWARVDGALTRLGAGEGAGERRHGVLPEGRPRGIQLVPSPLPERPAWLNTPAPVEARPPRPLAPSSLGKDDIADPPPSAAMRAAARRGSLLHRLFERLPGVSPAERRAAGDAWLRDAGAVAAAEERAELLDTALAVIEDPAHTGIFGSDALAEAPLTAVLADGRVIAGTVDRLLVKPDHIRLIDFKTGRHVPATDAQVPPAYRTQMEAYKEALAVIFPGRRVEASLLFTSGPALFQV